MVAHRAFLVECGTNFTEQNIEVTQTRQTAAEQWHTLALYLAVATQALEHIETLCYLKELQAFEIKTANLRRFEIGAEINHRRQRRGRTTRQSRPPLPRLPEAHNPHPH